MRVKAQYSMSFNLEKCIGCNTCTVACKNVWTNREGAEYMWWNNVETKPGIGYPKRWEDQDLWRGGWVRQNNTLHLRYGGRTAMLLNLFFNPHMPEMADYYDEGVYTFTCTGKMEKCILCYPRVESGLPPVCFHSCVGRIRSFGVVLYDMERVPEAALADDEDIVHAQRSIILDPFEEEVIAQAKASGIPDEWIDAAQRSPVFKLFKKWELALPLHPEFRTLPMLFYIPPLSPAITSLGQTCPDDKDIFDMAKTQSVLPDIDELDKLRIPMKYLANMFAAGNEEEVKKSLRRQLAVRHYERSLRVDGTPNIEVLERVGLTEEDAKGITRALSLAFYGERFVIPTTKRESADISPYTERGTAGFIPLSPWAPVKRRRSYYKAHHDPNKKYE